MNTTPKSAKVLMTLFVWGPTVEDAMNEAKAWEKRGFTINGNPAPMSHAGKMGTGVSISVEVNDEEKA